MEDPGEDGRGESDKAGHRVTTCSPKDNPLPDIRCGGNEVFPENVLNNASSGSSSVQNKGLKESATPSLDGAGNLSAIQQAMADPESKVTDEVTLQASTTGDRDQEQLVAIEPKPSDQTLVSADMASSVESKTVHSQSTEALLQLEPEMAQKGSGERKQSTDSVSGCCFLLNWSRVRKRIETKTDKYREGEKAKKRSYMPFRKKKKCPADYSAVPLHSEGGPESLDVVAHISTENTVAMEPIKECRKNLQSRRMSNRSSLCEIFRRIFTTRGMKRDSSQTEALHRGDASSAMSLKSEESRKGQDNEGQKYVFNYADGDERPSGNDAEVVITGATKIQKPKVDLVNLPSLDSQDLPFDVKDNSSKINQNDPVLIKVEDKQQILSSTTVPVAKEVCSRQIDSTIALMDKDNLQPVGLENKTINIIISEVNDYSDGEVNTLVNKYENNRTNVNDDRADLKGSCVAIMAPECLNDETLGDKVISIESESLFPQNMIQESTSDANVTKYNFNTNLEEESSSEGEIRVNTSGKINKMREFTVDTHNMDVQVQPRENQQDVPAQEDNNCTAKDVGQETVRDGNGTCMAEVPAAVNSHPERGVLEDDLDIDTVIGLFRDILEDIEIADVETEQSYQDISSSSPNESRDSAALKDEAAERSSDNVQAVDTSICDGDIVGPNKMGPDEERSIGDKTEIHEEVEVMDKGLDVISVIKVDAKELISLKCESGREQSFLENEAVPVMSSNTDEVEVEVGSVCLSTSGNNAATCMPDLTKNEVYDDTAEKAGIKKPNGSMRRKRRRKNKDHKEKLKSNLDNETRRLYSQESLEEVGNNGSTSTVTDTTAVSSISNGTETSKSDSLSPSDEQINGSVKTVAINFGQLSANPQEQANIATVTTQRNKSKRRRKRRRRRKSGKLKVEDVAKQCLSNERLPATGEFKTSFVAVESDTKSDSSNDVQKSERLKAAGDTEKGAAAQIDGEKGKIWKIKRKRQSSKTDSLLEEPVSGLLSIQALSTQEGDSGSLCNLVESQKDIVVPCSSERNRETSGVESEDSHSDGFQADSSRSSSCGNGTKTSVDHRTQEVMLNGLPNLNDNEECNPEEDNLTKIAREIISSVLSAAINQVIGKVNEAETSTPEWIFLQDDGTQSKRNDGLAPEVENNEKTCGATLEETAALIVTEAIENACRTFSTEISGNLVDNGNTSWQSTGGSSNSDDTIAEIANHWNTESFSDNSPNDAANFPTDSQSVA